VRILATIEESDRILPKSWDGLTVWLKIAHSSEAIWGYKLGQIRASIRPKSDDMAHIVNLGLFSEISATIPEDAPPEVAGAFAKLSSQMDRHMVDNKAIKEFAAVLDKSLSPAPPSK